MNFVNCKILYNSVIISAPANRLIKNLSTYFNELSNVNFDTVGKFPSLEEGFSFPGCSQPCFTKHVPRSL